MAKKKVVKKTAKNTKRSVKKAKKSTRITASKKKTSLFDEFMNLFK